MQLSHGWRAVVMIVLSSMPALAQSVPPPPRTVNLSGPRFGVSWLSPGVVHMLPERSIEVRPLITQFGWQFEKQFFNKGSGLRAVHEWVVLVGGLEQDVVLPSVSWIVGLRTQEGAEFGIGPNVTPAGTAVVLAAGITFRSGTLNLPVNFAVVPSKAGTRSACWRGSIFGSNSRGSLGSRGSRGYSGGVHVSVASSTSMARSMSVARTSTRTSSRSFSVTSGSAGVNSSGIAASMPVASSTDLHHRASSRWVRRRVTHSLSIE